MKAATQLQLKVLASNDDPKVAEIAARLPISTNASFEGCFIVNHGRARV